MGTRTFKTGSKRDSSNNKPPLSKLPFPALKEVAFVHQYGDSQFGTGNWKKGQPYSALSDSMLRHWEAWFYKLETTDAKSGLHHLAHAAWNCLVLLWQDLFGRHDMDDRQTYHGDWNSRTFADTPLAKQLEKGSAKD